MVEKMEKNVKREIVVGTLVSNIGEAWGKQQKWTDLVLRIKSNDTSEQHRGKQHPEDNQNQQSLELPEKPQKHFFEQTLSSDMDTEDVLNGLSATGLISKTDLSELSEIQATTDVSEGKGMSTKDVETSEKNATPNYVEFPCHKFILSSRSPVFKTLLESGKVDVLEFENMVPDTVQILLNFIYTDTIAKKLVNTQVLEAADRFGIEDLKSICCKVLCPSVGVENAIDLFLVARLTKVKALEERARYIHH